MNIRYPIYEGVYRILTIIGEEEIPNERALLTQEDGPMMASS